MSTLYTLKYNFGPFQSDVRYLLHRLAERSLNYFNTQVAQGTILYGKSPESEQYRHEQARVISFIANTEEYLYYNYTNNNRGEFHEILTDIAEVKAISVLDDKDRGIFGVTHPTKYIQINPNLSGNNLLTSDERTRLYVAHELGHVVNGRWMNSVRNFLNEKPGITNAERIFMYEGVSLLDEATTQERAESIAYYFARKPRPYPRNFKDPRGMYNGEPYKTNFDFYGELEAPAVLFGKTLRGLGSISSDPVVMSRLSRRALSHDFLKRIIEEYKKDGQIANLYEEFKYMGVIKKASYARFGYDSQDNLKNSKKALDVFTAIATPLRDYREPYED